jgi:hypothetical protein
MAYLTSRTQASNVACGDLVHIVKTNDFTQGNPDGSSYKATVGQLLSGCCVNDFYVKNIHGCNTGNLFVQPLDEGNIYFGANTAEDGFTIDLTTANPNRARVGINKNNPAFTIDAVSYDGRQKFFWYDNLAPIAGSAYANAEYLAMSGSGEIVSNFVVYGPGGPNGTVQGAGGIGMGFIGFDFDNNDTINGFGAPGDAFIAAAGCTENLNIINDRRNSSCDSSSDNIRFYAHYGAEGGTNTPHLHIQGRANATSQQGEICVYCTDPTERLDVNGNVKIRGLVPAITTSVSVNTSGVLVLSSSDIRLKENITTIDNALDKVVSMRGVNFSWKEDENSTMVLGFIAQEVEQVEPKLVFTNENTEDKIKGVHYDMVGPLLVEAVKELNEKTKLKEYTPTSISDPYGEKGDQVFDDNFMYIKTGAGWKKFPLMDI